MSKAEIFEKLTDIFRDVFDDGDITLTEATTAADIEETCRELRVLAERMVGL